MKKRGTTNLSWPRFICHLPSGRIFTGVVGQPNCLPDMRNFVDADFVDGEQTLLIADRSADRGAYVRTLVTADRATDSCTDVGAL